MSKPLDSTSTQKPIVAGVDGSTNNLPATMWAFAEGARSGLPVKLLTVTEQTEIRTPGFAKEPTSFNYVDYAYGSLEQVATRAGREYPDVEVSTDVIVDDALGGLVDKSSEASMVVVGKRGIGAIERMTLGSVSIALSGRSAVPTVVVPDDWDADVHRGQSILVGLDLHHDADPLLEFAFTRAQELGVPLVVLHVWDTHPAIVPGHEDLTRWSDEARAVVESKIAPWKAKFPEVDALAMAVHARTADGLLDEAAAAQLLVLGRHTRGHSPAGLGLRSVTRTVMHYGNLPIAVVPTVATD
ncbi:MAG TPA: universal stress protein [Nocardioidaceae bacterium]|nr:universal stress protein [Nocardioidaceae bacterium]